ncbi:MAG: prolyl oligopeptidase family serine peptidase [Oligoflexales bacterium]|nr:prolyl oligopeptidase family serine peptidase [Oligoflexales bacterium]
MVTIRHFILHFLACFLSLNQGPSRCEAASHEKLKAFKKLAAARDAVSWIDFRAKSHTSDYTYHVGSLTSGSLTDPVTGSSHNREASKLKPLLLVLPGIGGVSFYDHIIAKYFVRKGYRVAISHTIDVKNSLNPTKVDSVLQNNVLSSMSVLDALTQFDDVDEKKIGLLGSSYGGIRSSFLLKVEKRISAATLVVASTQFAKILATSDFFAVRYIRKRHMQQLGMTSIKQYEEYIHEKLPFEPHDCVDDAGNDHHLVIRSKLDDVVPAKLQESFALQLKNARHVCFENLGHIGSLFWYVTAYLPYTYHFFCERWGEVPKEDPHFNDWNDDDLEEALLSWD